MRDIGSSRAQIKRTFVSIDVDETPNHQCLALGMQQSKKWVDASERVPDAVI